VVKSYYKSLKQMSKLREVATIPIPCLPVSNEKNKVNNLILKSVKHLNITIFTPQIPYHYQNQNIYLSTGGLKHELGGLTEQNYVV
jgi:hypothetical protein